MSLHPVRAYLLVAMQNAARTREAVAIEDATPSR